HLIGLAAGRHLDQRARKIVGWPRATARHHRLDRNPERLDVESVVALDEKQVVLGQLQVGPRILLNVELRGAIGLKDVIAIALDEWIELVDRLKLTGRQLVGAPIVRVLNRWRRLTGSEGLRHLRQKERGIGQPTLNFVDVSERVMPAL